MLRTGFIMKVFCLLCMVFIEKQFCLSATEQQPEDAVNSVVSWGQRVIPARLFEDRYSAVATSWGHALALRTNGTVVAWGQNWWGECSVPIGLNNVTAIAAGWNHSIALKADGTVTAWGTEIRSGSSPPPDYGQGRVPIGLSGVTAVAAGGDHNLVLKADKTVQAWGDNRYGQCNVPSNLNDVVSISAGAGFSIALRSDGTVVGWGSNFENQIAIPAGVHDVIAISAGSSHALALRADGSVISWGSNHSGETNVPFGLRDAIGIEAGSDRSTAIRKNGTIVVWGGNLVGENSPPAGLSNIVNVSSRSWLTWALKGDGSLTNWGFRGLPVGLPTFGQDVVAIAAGENDIALTRDGRVITWASDMWMLAPVPAELGRVTKIASGQSLNLATLNFDGVVATWGDRFPDLHDNLNRPGVAKFPLSSRDISSVALGEMHGLALKEDGTVLMWGTNRFSSEAVPPGLSNVAAIASGPWHNLALRSNGTVVAWGLNDSRQCAVPSGLSDVIAVAAGADHSIALRRDGTVSAWGWRFHTRVPEGLSDVVAIAAGFWHGLALKNDGTVVGWGGNRWGESTPPIGLSNIVAIAGGTDYSLALQRTPQAPKIASLSPHPVPARSGRQWLTLKGQGFAQDSQVILRRGTETFLIPKGRTEFIDSGQLRMFVNVGERPADWTAEVRNAGGNASTPFAFSVSKSLVHAEKLTINGPVSVSGNSGWNGTALAELADLTHLDVTGQCRWFVEGTAPPDVFFSGDELYVGDIAQETTITVRAEYTFSGGRILSPPFALRVLPSTIPRIDFTARTAAITLLEWQLELEATVTGTDPSTLAFSWDFDNDGRFDDATGKSVSDTWFRSPGTWPIKLLATRGTEKYLVEHAITLDKPPEANQPTVQTVADPNPGAYLNSKQEEFQFDDTAETGRGIIILTHGLRSSGYEPWIGQMARSIESRLGNKPPYVIIYDWGEDARPSAGLPLTLLEKANPLKASVLQWTYDLTQIRFRAEAHGDQLAFWIENQMALKKLDSSKPIHLIGHSAGGYVVTAAARELQKRGISVSQVTTLDTPLPPTIAHSVLANPTRVDRYVAQLGSVSLNPVGEAFRVLKETEFFHQKVVFGLSLNPFQAHKEIYQWYRTDTIDTITEEGFYFSPFLNNRFPGANLAAGSLRANGVLLEESLVGFKPFGDVTISEVSSVIREDSNAGMFLDSAMPVGAQELKFRFRFTAPGDGDFLTVHWGTNQVLFLGTDLELSREDFATAEISIAEHAGTTNQLVFKLVSRGEKNAVLVIDQVRISLTDDPDGDSLETTQELVLLTDPLNRDSDLDGLPDGEERNLHFTDPLTADSDRDGMPDGFEVLGGMDPLDANSVLRLESIQFSGQAAVELTWTGRTNQTYRVHRAESMSSREFDTLTNGLAGIHPFTRFVDLAGTNLNSFYWIETE